MWPASIDIPGKVRVDVAFFERHHQRVSIDAAYIDRHGAGTALDVACFERLHAGVTIVTDGHPFDAGCFECRRKRAHPHPAAHKESGSVIRDTPSNDAEALQNVAQRFGVRWPQPPLWKAGGLC
jgi:hypothetical protein